MSSFPTPQMDHATPLSSATPTRQSSSQSQSQGGATPSASGSHAAPAHYDLTSPSDYLNESAFSYTEPNTPYGQYTHGQDTGFLPMQANGDHSHAHQQWSHEQPSLHHPQPVVSHHGALTDDYGLNFDEFGRVHSPGDDGHVTPPALSVPEDESTPVVSDKQAPIPSSSFPQPPAHASTSYNPASSLGQDYTTTHNASHRHHVSPDLLMSPFQPMADQHSHQYSDQFEYMATHQPPAFIDPSTFQHQHQHQATGYHFNPQLNQQAMPAYPGYYPNGSPFDMTATNGFMPHQPVPMNMPPPPAFAGGGPVPHDPRNGGWPAYGPARSRGPSPSSSISSSAVSLVRTLSTNSDIHQPTQRSRPKVKLSWQDKADIVKLSKSNKTMRQEDIARLYGVDRSTISKIVMQADRWINPQAIPPPAPRPPRPHNGRHPAVEEQMNLWMDEAIAGGRDVRDPVLKKEAMRIADELGFPPGRFKASAKWIDKFKERRTNLGKPVQSPMLNGTVVYAAPPLVPAFPMTYGPGPSNLNAQRPQSSATTYSSSGSSVPEGYQLSPNPDGTMTFMPAPAQQSLMANPLGLTRSESDLTQTNITPGARSRSQSSPQQMGDANATTPSSGRPAKMPRPSPMGLQRQESYHGTSRSPRRPAGLTRANSIAGSGGSSRRNRPGSLGASVFGFSQITSTPLNGGSGSPSLHSPANSIGSSVGSQFGGGHARTRSDVPGLTPIASGISGMTISPGSESGNTGSSNGHIMPNQGTIPLTPATPAGTSVPDHPAVSLSEIGVPAQQHYASTMPGKHYAPAPSPAYGYTGSAAAGSYSPYTQTYSQPPSNFASPVDAQNSVWQ